MTTITDNKPQIFDKTLADRLRIFRSQYIHKSQNQAAKMLQVPQSNLSYMESGRLPIRYEFISKLIKNFALNQDWFNNGNGKPTDKNPPKSNMLTDLNALMLEIETLKKQLKFMELNHKYLIQKIEEMERKIDKK